MSMTRTANATWTGDLLEGSGSTRLESAADDGLELTWRARTEESGGETSPEELIAAAHAACFSMALSHALSEAGNEPQKLDVSADVTIASTDDGWRIKSVALKVTGEVDVDEGEFAEMAETAKEACPVSNALRGNVDISVDAKLAS